MNVSHATSQTGCDKRFRQVQTANEVLLRDVKPRNSVDEEAMNEAYKTTGTVLYDEPVKVHVPKFFKTSKRKSRTNERRQGSKNVS